MKLKVKDICMMSILLAILIVTSKITIPTGIVPITLQTFAVTIIALILGFKKSTIVILTYILMGLFGIPVFSSGGGMHYIFSPTFGYIIGFLFQAMIISKASNKDNKWLKYVLSILGILVDYLFGSIYFAIIEAYYLNTAKDFIFIFNSCINYFYIFDFIKIILACLIYSRIKVIYTISVYEKENTFIENKYKNEGI